VLAKIVAANAVPVATTARIRATVSVGAAGPRDAQTPTRCASADSAMYAAKKRGQPFLFYRR
jgi:GGDEF domain-containing protein